MSGSASALRDAIDTVGTEKFAHSLTAPFGEPWCVGVVDERLRLSSRKALRS